MAYVNSDGRVDDRGPLLRNIFGLLWVIVFFFKSLFQMDTSDGRGGYSGGGSQGRGRGGGGGGGGGGPRVMGFRDIRPPPGPPPCSGGGCGM